MAEGSWRRGHAPLPPARDGATARDVVRRCAAAARALLLEAAAKPRLAAGKGFTSGGRSDIVTSTDPAIERAVITILTEAYPDHAVLGEETGQHPGDAEWLWVIDPIDGTRNFSAGIPWVAFNLALYHQGAPHLALTLDAFQGEMFYAEAGRGTLLNERTVRVTQPERLADTFLGVDIGMDDARGRALLAELHNLFPGVQAIRILGTAALGMAYVAAGRLDAYIHPSPYAWDFAPGVLLVREAGGVVTDGTGGPVTLASRSIVAAGAGVQAHVVDQFRSVFAV